MNNLRQYLKDLREVSAGPSSGASSVTEYSPNTEKELNELLDYSVRHIRNLLKSKITEKLQGAQQIDINKLWSIIDELS